MFNSVEEFRDAIQAHFPLEDVMYQPILHPLFEGWITSRPCPETLELILESYGDVADKTVLDLGCALGYYSHRLAEKWADVTAVELKTPRYEFCLYLSKMYGFAEYNPLFINTDIIEFAKGAVINAQHYDVTLFLNTVHWLFIQRGHDAAFTALDNISACTDKMYLSYGGSDFTPFLCVENTQFTKYENLGLPKKKGRGKKREIYLFTK